MKCNMKIEINESQPLDEVVKELERIGYTRDIDCHHDGLYGVIAFEFTKDFNTCDDYDFNNGFLDYKEITLAELRGI